MNTVETMLEVFDGWELLFKARQPIGLEKWSKLQYLADSLKGKKASDITFTTCYPGQEGSKKTLGSVEGNLHFLMGYANPAFHISAYHFRVVDPNLSAVEAESLYRAKGHPSRVELWERSGLEMKDEGDLVDGNPHPAVADVREVVKLKAARKAESITVSSGIGSYTAIPSEGIVYGNHNKQVYAWDMVRNSFFAAANPDLAEKMEESFDQRQEFEEEIIEYQRVPEPVKHTAKGFVGRDFDFGVYPLVKSFFPVPSTIIPMDSNTGEVFYGVVTPSSIDFFDRDGGKARLSMFDSAFDKVDLMKDGNTYASVVYDWGKSLFAIPDDLDEFLHVE